MSRGPALLAVASVMAGLTGWLMISPRPGGPWPGRRRPGRVDRLLSRARGSRPIEVAALLDSVAAELAAGQPTRLALVAGAQDLDPAPCPRALAAARIGGDVVAALRADARAPGCADLRALAACWDVAEHSGAGLALAVGRLASGVRAAERGRAELAGEVAAVRASARILAALPLLGLGIAHWIGAQPLTWLVAANPGRVVLLAGVALQAAGLAWLHRIVSVASRSL